MASKEVSVTVGPGVVGLLGVAFVVLKLCGVINWPWLWVLAPFWLGIAVLLAILLVASLCMLLVFLVTEFRR